MIKLGDSLASDPEIQAHWARYLCVLISGFLETSLQDILTQHAECTASKTTARYVARRLGQFQNAKMQQIYDLVGSFDEDWQVRLKSECEGEIAAAIDAIVSNRHSIAHGRDVGMSLVSIKAYYANVVKLLDLVEGRCAKRQTHSK